MMALYQSNIEQKNLIKTKVECFTNYQLLSLSCRLNDKQISPGKIQYVKLNMARGETNHIGMN